MMRIYIARNILAALQIVSVAGAVFVGPSSPGFGATLPAPSNQPAATGSDPSFRNLDEIQLGQLELSKLPPGSAQFKTLRISDDTVWNGIEVSADSGVVKIFSDRTRNHLVLSGTVKRLRLSAQLSVVPFAPHTQILVPPHGLELELDNVKGGVATTAATELRATGSHLVLSNDGELKVSDREFSGEFYLHISKPLLVGIKLFLAPGPNAASLAFESLRGEGDVDAVWPLDHEEAKIVSGEFSFAEIKTKGDVLIGPEVATATDLRAKSGKLSFSRESPRVLLTSISLSGVSAGTDDLFGLKAETDGALTSDSILFRQQTEHQSLVTQASEAKGLKANLRLIQIKRSLLIADKGSVLFDGLSSTEMSGVLTLLDANLNSKPFQGTRFSSLKLSFSGSIAHPKVSGEGAVTAAAIGGLQVTKPSRGVATFSSNDDGSYSLAISLTGPGDFVLGTRESNGLSGQLASLNAKGSVRNTDTLQFAVPKDGLTVSVSSALTNLEVLGQPLQLPSGAISLSNDSPIVIGSGNGNEVLKSNLPAVQLQQVFIEADDDTKDAPISVPIPNTDTDKFSLGWDISTGAVTILGSVTIPGFSVTVPDPPKYLWIRTKDFDIQLSSLSIQSFTIAFVGSAVQISINGISITGNQFLGRQPDYSGVLSKPVSAQTIKGTIPLKTPIALKSLEFDDVEVSIDNGVFESNTLNVSQASLLAHLVSASSTTATGDIAATTGTVQVSSEIGGGTTTVAALQFKFQRSGDSLSGSGRLDVGPMKYDISADVPMGPGKCSETLKYHVIGASTGTTANISVESNELFGPFIVHPSISQATTSYYRCDYKEHVIVAHAVKGHYTYPCPTWREPLRTCDGWTYISPEISFDVPMVFEIQPLAGFAAIAELHGEFNNGKAVGCWFRPINVVTSPALIVWGPNAPGLPGVALRIAEGTVESSLANSLVYSVEQFVDLMIGRPFPLMRCVSSPINF
jgi:hypothetical protein